MARKVADLLCTHLRWKQLPNNMGKGCQHSKIMEQTFCGDGSELKEVEENPSIDFCEMSTLGENIRTDVSISRRGGTFSTFQLL